MKKITKVIALLMAAALMFSGCASGEITSIINNDGSAKINEVVLINKTEADTILKSVGYTKPEEFINAMVMEDGFKYEVVKKDDGKEYYQLRKDKTISAKNLSKGLTEEMGGDVYATKDTIYANINSESLKAAENSVSGYDINSAVKVTFYVEFSSAVVSTNGTINKLNPKQVEFNVPVDKSSVLFATTSSSITQSSIKAKIDSLNSVTKPKIKKINVKNIKKKAGTVIVQVKKIKDVKYEVEYSTSKKFSTLKTSFKSSKKPTIILKNLKKGKKYYIRVRAYKNNYAGSEVYSKWAKKTIKVIQKTKKR